VQKNGPAQKSPFAAAVPVVVGVVGGAFAMSAAFAMSSSIRPEPAPRTLTEVSRATAVATHLAPASQDPQVRILAFNAPLAGFSINSPFGMRRMPWEEGGRLHEGVDIAAPAGTPVAATLAGTVTRTGTSASYGRFIEVRHADGLVSFYAHLSRVAPGLKAGSKVAEADIVGYVGGTGRSTGAHLHFEIRRNGQPLNPALFIGRSFASVEQLPLKDAARVGRTRVAVVSNWPASVRAAASNRAPGEVDVASLDDGRVRAVLMPGDTARKPMEIVARDPKKAAEARARLREIEAEDAPQATAPALKAEPAKPKPGQGGTPIPLSRIKVQPVDAPPA
jgi:hypothetical protein